MGSIMLYKKADIFQPKFNPTISTLQGACQNRPKIAKKKLYIPYI